jgi:hypothetical protein
MPKIKIFRKRDWTIKSSVFEVLLDGQRIGYISKGETNEYDVPTGQHKLKVKMGRVGSKDINCTIFNKETKTFTTSFNRKMSIIILILLLLGGLFNFFVQNEFKTVHFYKYALSVTIAITALFSYIIFFTIAQIHFLNIKES